MFGGKWCKLMWECQQVPGMYKEFMCCFFGQWWEAPHALVKQVSH
jgi:hypothetical protein